MRVALKSTTTLAGLAALSLAAATLPMQVATAAPATPHAGKVIVKFADGVDPADVLPAWKKEGAEVGAVWKHAMLGAAVTLPPGLAKKVANDPRVEFVEPDVQVQSAAAPWDLDRLDQASLPLNGSFSPAATGSGVPVYVLDTGVRSTHLEFAGRMRPGYDALGQGTTEDCNGHGTFVAGAAAGATLGSARGALVVPVRILQCDGGGYASKVVSGINWVIAQHAVGTPAVINLSIGGTASTAMDDAVKAAVADGIVVVAAAGNQGGDACSYSPARVAAAVTVGATDSADGLASFSNRGACVDLHAPGVGVVSALSSSDSGSGAGSGTSYAAPLAAGAAAAWLGGNPSASPAEVELALKNAASHVVRSVPSGTTQALLQLASTAAPAPAPTESSTPEPEPTATTAPEPTETVSPEPTASPSPTKVRGGGKGTGATKKQSTRK